MTLKLDMQHKGLGLYQVCANDDPWLILTCFTATSNLVTWAFVWEKRANSGFCEAIVAYDIKVDIYNQLNELL